MRGSRGEARCSRSTTAANGSPASRAGAISSASGPRDPADLDAAGVDGDRVRVVRVGRVAAELERPAGLRGLGGERLGVVAPGAGHAGDPQAGGRELRGVAAEVAPVRRDGLEAREPHDAAVVRVPVALLALDVDDHAAQA